MSRRVWKVRVSKRQCVRCYSDDCSSLAFFFCLSHLWATTSWLTSPWHALYGLIIWLEKTFLFFFLPVFFSSSSFSFSPSLSSSLAWWTRLLPLASLSAKSLDTFDRHVGYLVVGEHLVWILNLLVLPSVFLWWLDAEKCSWGNQSIWREPWQLLYWNAVLSVLGSVSLATSFSHCGKMWQVKSGTNLIRCVNVCITFIVSGVHFITWPS